MNYSSHVITALLLATIAGAMLPTQAGINSLLAKSGAGTLWAAFISFAVGTLVLFVMIVTTQHNLSLSSINSRVEWWYFLGGVLGVFYVGIAIFTAPIIGATQLVVMVITGQIVASILIDHFGLLGFEKHSIEWKQVFGIALVSIGFVLIKK